MLILPLIDLLILLGSGCLVFGFLMKAIEITTRYVPSVLGFSAIDFLLMTGVCWGFALVLAARSWVKLNEPKIMAMRREQFAAEARRQAREMELSIRASDQGGLAPPDDVREAAGGERR